MKKVLDKLRVGRLRRDEGASAVEYGLLVALIAVIIAGTVALLGGALSDKFRESCSAVANAGDAAGECADPTP